MTASVRKLEPLSSVFSYFSVWMFAAFSSIYVKSQIISYTEIGRGLGRVEIAEMTQQDPSRAYLFSFLERLSFYRLDLLLAFVILPLIGALVLTRIPHRWRMISVVTATSAVVLFLFLQIKGYWMVRHFQSWGLWCDAIKWGLQNHADAGNYFSAEAKAKLFGSFLLPCGYGFIVSKRWSTSPGTAPFFRMTILACYGGILLLTAASWCSRISSTSYHRSALGITLLSFFDLNEVNISKFNSLGPADAMVQWRSLTDSPAPKSAPDHFGSARDCDVILFVMETAPSKAVDLTGNLDDLPNLKWLRKRAWVAVDHVSTYPYTSSALFSILSSWYPTDVVDYVRDPDKKVEVPGLMRSLGASGYATAAYATTVASKEDEALHYAVGISKIVYSADSMAPGTQSAPRDWKDKVQLDKLALELLKKDVSGWIRQNKRYAVLYLPQIGHGPWPDVTDSGKNVAPLSRGRSIVALQDKWLGELVQFLKASGRLDRTIILVTGDHGIRTRLEDPDFAGGAIDSYSFQVPCVLYAPQAKREEEVIPWTTSHIDLSPSILDLLGVTHGRGYELGSPLWDRRLNNRTTFLYANKYLGADGFHREQKYYMWQYLTGSTFTNSSLTFSKIMPLHENDSIAKYASRTISDSRALMYQISRLGSKTAAAVSVD